MAANSLGPLFTCVGVPHEVSPNDGKLEVFTRHGPYAEPRLCWDRLSAPHASLSASGDWYDPCEESAEGPVWQRRDCLPTAEGGDAAEERPGSHSRAKDLICSDRLEP